MTISPKIPDAALSRFAARDAVSRSSPAAPPAAPRSRRDLPAEYAHATRGCALFRRADRGLLRVWGRAPRQMLHGMLTNRIPDPPRALPPPAPPLAAPDGGGCLAGERTYGTVLTRKGRIVSDVRTFWLGASEEAGIALDAAMAGRDALLAHFAKYLPPRLARLEDLAAEAGALTLAGARAGAVAAEVFGGVPADGCWLLDGGPAKGGLALAGGLEQTTPSWDVWGRRPEIEAVADKLERAGAVPAGWETWESLRVEAGYPAYGADIDETVIPVEAGLDRRAIDHDKGCYTGQEVVVRVLHRGRVNWRLRALRFADAEGKPGDRLFRAWGGKACGRVTSSARSPKLGEWIGMGYVRREVVPPAVLRLDAAEGTRVAVERLPPESR